MRKSTRWLSVPSLLAALSLLSACAAHEPLDEEAKAPDVTQAALELTPAPIDGAVLISPASMSKRCQDAIERCYDKCDESCSNQGRSCASVTVSSPSGGCACLSWGCTSTPNLELLDPAVFQTP